ncbi:hypothetical protein BN1723_009784 [Verticillium longisporum]|jgi:hypothetical protein
MLFD